jgi:hypothetical protein
LAVCGSVVALATAASGQTADEIQRARERVYDRQSYQSELPEPEKLDDPHEALERLEREGFLPPPPPEGLGAIMRVIFWVFVIACGCFLVFAIVHFIAQRGRHPDAQQALAGSTDRAVRVGEDAPSLSRQAHDDAEHLAAEGRFAEAIHVLLLRTLTELGRKEGRFSVDLTSREILAKVRVREDPRQALKVLVGSVEKSLFAQRPVDRMDYDRAVDCYERFRETYLRGPA